MRAREQRIAARLRTPDSVATPAATDSVNQAKRKQSERGAAADLLPAIAIERGGVAIGIGRTRIALGSAGATAALTVPAHRRPVAAEAVTMAQELAAQHPHSY